jgi:uncharacterized membrane protein YtjA (UPF0391 family)
MLDLALVLLFAALAAGLVAFSGDGGTAAVVAQPVFFVFLLLFLAALIARRRVPT